MKSIGRLFSFAIIATTICGAYGANVSTRAVSKRSTVANSTQTKSTRSTTRQQSAAKRGVANRSAVTYRANPYKTFSNGYQQTRMYIHKDFQKWVVRI